MNRLILGVVCYLLLCGMTFSGGIVASKVTVSDSPNKILCLGDSITNGIGDADNIGYLSHLRALQQSITFIGPITSEYTWRNYYLHAAVRGEKSDAVEARTLAALASFTKYEHGVVLLHIGTNDITASVSAADITQNIIDIIDIINTYNSNIDIYVALIIPRTDAFDSDTTAFNSTLETALISKQTTKYNLYYVDINSAFKSDASWATDYMNDTLHPNDAGYAVMAHTWSACIDDKTATYCNGN